MRAAAEVMQGRQDEITGWLVRESGGTLAKAELEWNLVRSVLWEASAMPHHVEGRIVPSDIPGKENRIYREPVGVVAVISPWNFPLQLSARSVAPASSVPARSSATRSSSIPSPRWCPSPARRRWDRGSPRRPA
jgi:aldehyde dehydrogenase (NAD+)